MRVFQKTLLMFGFILLFALSGLSVCAFHTNCKAIIPKSAAPERCSTGSKAFTTTSWVYEFVRYNNISYLPTKNTISNINAVIGQVKYYSIHEQDDSNKNFFSNCYKKGAILYSIKGVSVKVSIAVKISANKYVKLVNIKNTSLRTLI